MKKLLSLLALVCLVLTASASKVYYDNSETKWDVVKAHYWGGDATETEWSGVEMTQGDNNVWSIEIQGTPSGIIFNDGNGNQTSDLKFVDGATYDKNGVKGAELNEYTVYYDNTKSDWEIVKAYYWDGGAKNSWPGDDLTKGENNVWTFTFKAQAAPKKIQFNNGTNKGQSVDLDFEDGATYDKDGKVGGSTGGDDPVSPTPDPETVVVALAGDFNDWSKTANTATTVDNCATFTFTEWPGGGFKFIIDGKYYGDTYELQNDVWFEDCVDSGMGNNLTLPEEAKGQKVVIKVAADTKHVKATWGEGAGDDPVVPTPGEYPAKFYVIGDLEGSEWAPGAGIEAEGVNGVYTWNIKVVNNGYFAFVELNSSEWNGEGGINSGLRYGPNEENAPFAANDVLTVDLNWNSFKAEPGEYKVILDLTNCTASLLANTETGVAGVEAAALCGDVYNVAGVRVLRGADNAAVKTLPAGLYIVGGKKVLVK